MDTFCTIQLANQVDTKMKKKFIQWPAALVALSFLFFSFYPLIGQITLTGEVKAEDKQPIPFANILLLQPQDSALVMGDITDAEGKFSINVRPAEYLINISLIGYQSVYSLVKTSAEQPEVLLGTFQLLEDVRQLEEVVVKEQKPLFEKQIDRTVVNVQSRITNTGSSVLEVLEKSPGVMVNRQNNTLTMNGKSGVLVMINNKINRLPMDAVVQMLNGMSAANIEKIELITSPPAKYDAEGNAGIIHVVTTESPDFGTNGNFGATVGYNGAETLAGNFNITHRSRRLNTFMNYSINHDRNTQEWYSEHYFTQDGFTQSEIINSSRKPLTVVQNLQMGVEYDFTNKTSASLLVSGYKRKWDMPAVTTDTQQISPDSTIVTKMYIQELNVWQSATASLGLKHRLTDRQELSMAFDYLYYHNNNPSSYQNEISSEGLPEVETENINVEKKTPVNFQVANIDYTNNISDKFSMEAGAKSTFSQFTNDVQVSRQTTAEWVIDPEFTNIATLDEKILAAYWSGNWQPHANWDLKGGLRYEYTDTYLSTPEQAGLVDREFGNFFPSLFITHSLNEKNKLSLAYNRRITRPTFNDMAPFVFFFGPNTFVAGNLSIRPAISDGIDVNYQWKQFWLTLQYSYTKNAIAFLQPEFDEESGEQVFRSQNLKYLQTLGISTAFPLTVTTWWEMQNDVAFYYNIFETLHLEKNIQGSVSNFTFNTTSTFKLPANFSIELSANYQSGMFWGLTQFDPIGSVNLGIRKKLKNEAVITLAVNDLFDNYNWNFSTNVSDNIRNSVEYDLPIRSINLTYTYKFGNKKLKSVDIKSGSETERRRVQ